MIIYECIKIVLWCIARFIFWLITARDCDHCKHCSNNGGNCYERWIEFGDCYDSIIRKKFERRD